MICLSIALDAQRIKAGVVWMFHAQINEVSSRANLPFGLKTSPLKNSLNLNFKRRVTLFACCLALMNQNAALGVFEEQVEILNPSPFAINNDLIAPN